MSLHHLTPVTQRRLRRHATVLTLWCLLVGFVTSTILLRGFGMTHPATRYGVAAAVMYGLGLVLGLRFWLLSFAQSALADEASGRAAGVPGRPGAPAPASRPERSRTESRWDWLDVLNVFELGEAAFLLVIPAVVVALGALLFSLVGAPLLLADGLAGILAEVAVQFVLGALIARRVLRPRDPGDALLSIVGRTWVIGLLLVLASTTFGLTLRWLYPGAVALADVWR